MTDKLALKVSLPWLILDPKSWGRGVWFYALCRALRSRTEESIKGFISIDVPIILNLLCTVCSHEARILVTKRHPSKYLEIYDTRGENIGMYLWIFDIHNDVNKRLGHEIFSREDIDLFYLPLLELTTEQINDDWLSARNVKSLDQLWEVRFSPESWGPSGKGPDPAPESWGPGVWFYAFCRALRCRDKETIDDFIGYDLPILVGLLDSVSSEEAYMLIQSRHPSTYCNKKDHRGEMIGMYLWISDLHNDVNKHLKKQYYPQDFIDQMYKPLLSLTKAEIKEDGELAAKAETIQKLRHIIYGSVEIAVANTPAPTGERRIRGSAVIRLPIVSNQTSSRRLNPVAAAKLKH